METGSDRAPGIRRLIEKRGDEQVTFKDVADHLVDFVDRRPEDAPAVDALARFLAGVEDMDHEHPDDDSGTDAPAETAPAPGGDSR